MDIGKSIRIALAQRSLKNKDLAEQLDWHPQRVSELVGNSSTPNGATIEILAGAFGLEVSEFIALGEIEINK